MEIDQTTLNLVVELDRPDGPLIIHSMPISRAIFKRYYLPISKTFAAIYQQGLNYLAGPRIAAWSMEEISRDLNIWDGPGGVEQGFMMEIRRLSNAIVPRPGGGWTAVPLEDLIQTKKITEDELEELMSTLCFFTVASVMHRRSELPEILTGMASLWGAQITSLDCTAYAVSRSTSTEIETSAPAAGSPVPY